MTPSQYQIEIYNAAEMTEANLAVDAVAGSGKSKVLEEVTDIMLRQGRTTLFLCFNVRIKEAFSKRLMNRYGSMPKDILVSTLNGFGWGACLRGIPGIKREPDETKDARVFRKFFDLNDPIQKNRYYKWRGTAVRLIDLCKNLNQVDLRSPSQLGRIAMEYEVDMPDGGHIDEFLKCTVQALYDSVAWRETCSFTDQILFPILYDLPLRTFEVGLIDEAQDLNPLQQQIVRRACGRIIMCGDTHQAMYRFRGSDSEALQQMIKDINAVELPLSICYRCPRKSIELAKQVVPQIEAAPDAPEGIFETIDLDQFGTQAREGDAVLCRTTAPLVSECFAAIRRGKKAYVVGRDIGEALIGLIESICASGPTDPTTFQFRANLDAYEQEQTKRLTDAEKDAALIAMQDRVDTIRVLSEGTERVSEIYRRIDSIFPKKGQGSGVCFSTVHRSKGSEWDTVFILEPGLMPHPRVKNPASVIQEWNIYYVAVTRNRKALYFVVDEKKKKGEEKREVKVPRAEIPDDEQRVMIGQIPVEKEISWEWSVELGKMVPIQDDE